MAPNIGVNGLRKTLPQHLSKDVLLFDSHHRFGAFVDIGEAMMGIEKENVLGKVRHFLQVASTGEPCDFKDFNPQSGLWLILRVFRYESGHIGVFYDDITKTVAMENELRRVTREALAGAKAKSDFLAHMSHEIRTPLNGVLATASLIQQLELDPKVRDYVDLIARSGDTLMTVINDVLDVARIEAGKLTLDPNPESPKRIIEDVIALHHPQADSIGISLRVVYDGFIPEFVMVDAVRLRQVLGNLVSNALKFTGSGGVEVRVKAQSAGNQTWRMEYAVADTGIGIASDKLTAIFDAFAQAEGSTYRRFGGTGLGLTISKHIAKLMGGSLEVSSVVGEGSVFTIKFACKEAQAVAALTESARAQQRTGIKVLLAEDNEVNAIVARHALEQLNCVVTHVWDGLEAVCEASKSRFDLILLDVHMPKCNGLEASKLIRSSPNMGRSVIGAFTAGITEDEVIECRRSGMDFVLSKPFTVDKIREVLAERFPEHINLTQG